jgi:hypothetical protein
VRPCWAHKEKGQSRVWPLNGGMERGDDYH